MSHKFRCFTPIRIGGYYTGQVRETTKVDTVTTEGKEKIFRKSKAHSDLALLRRYKFDKINNVKLFVYMNPIFDEIQSLDIDPKEDFSKLLKFLIKERPELVVSEAGLTKEGQLFIKKGTINIIQYYIDKHRSELLNIQELNTQKTPTDIKARILYERKF